MAATASRQQSIDIVREFNDRVFNAREYDALPEIQSSDYVQHGPLPGVDLHGTDQSLETLQLFHSAFSDLASEEELTFCDGDLVCTRYTYTGTHDGDFMGVPATNIEVTVPGTMVNRIENGKIAETWASVDLLGLMQQLELVPELSEITA